MRAVLKTIPNKLQKEIAEKIKEAMENPLQLSKVVEYLEEESLARLLKHWIDSISILITIRHFQKSIAER